MAISARALVTLPSNGYISEQHEPLIEKIPVRRSGGDGADRRTLVRASRDGGGREERASGGSMQIKLTRGLMRYEMKIVNRGRARRRKKKISHADVDEARIRVRAIFLPRCPRDLPAPCRSGAHAAFSPFVL